MDENAIEAKGLKPLQPEFARIDAMKTAQDLAPVLAHLHTVGVNVMFNFSSGQDSKDSTSVIAPGRSGRPRTAREGLLFRDDEHSVATRKEYVAHVTRMLKLMGVPAAQAAKHADAIMSLETAMAKASLDVTSRRDPQKIYHLMTLAKFEAWTIPSTGAATSRDLDIPKIDNLNVVVAGFFHGSGTTPQIRIAG